MKQMVGLAAMVTLTGACSHGQQVQPSSAQQWQQPAEAPPAGWQQPGPAAQAGASQSCPMAVAGTELSVAETANGIALAFTTDSGDVKDLRARVRRAADQYRSQQKMQQPPPGSQGMKGEPGTQGEPGTAAPQTPQPAPGTPGTPAPGTPGSGSYQTPGTSGEQSGSGTGGSDQSGSTGSGDYQGPGEQSQGMNQGQPGEQQGEAGQGTMAPMHQLGSIPYNVYVEDIDRGARLVFTPQNPSHMQALRDQIRQHASRMQPGECPPRVSRR